MTDHFLPSGFEVSFSLTSFQVKDLTTGKAACVNSSTHLHNVMPAENNHHQLQQQLVSALESADEHVSVTWETDAASSSEPSNIVIVGNFDNWQHPISMMRAENAGSTWHTPSHLP
jgi:hypothetical protein